ncbi:ATP12 chaperone protein [Aquimixticola soesokkakensis]|uniref:ATP12 chaperone protein n=1 Tax=Aquimixticola soesokkakensis TaxID=1519096 RepID=A0A1Y5T3S1_9RHOB|nr:ATP12 family protein [Aquimixticola soesokkakensis]SLN51658.1 ATP12 chaperone protein [Aquimixticola soesokkakensis]
MSNWAAKRFWKAATVQDAADGFTVFLDGRAVKTPAKAALIVPTRALAEAIAQEWDAQGETVDPNTMPVTRGANAALDKVAIQHAEVAQNLAAYGDSDLLCYRAAQPQELVMRQAEAWDPLLDWAHETFQARLHPRTGVMHQAQDSQALARLSARVHALTPFQMAGFHDLVALSGSLILGLAATEDARPIEVLWALSRLDEEYQIEQWGHDEEAAELVEIKRAAFVAAHRFYHMAS